MATYTWRTVSSRRKEWIVPATRPWGAFLGDIQSAILAATIVYRRDHNLPEDHVLFGDALSFKPGDDEIVISYTIEETER